MTKPTAVSKSQCPACANRGNDRSHNNLVTYSDNGQHCFACGYHVCGETGDVSQSFELPDFIEIPDQGIKTRTIPKNVCDVYGVVNELTEDYRPIGAGKVGFEQKRTPKLIYPYYDKAGKLVGTKVIDYSKAKDEPGRFTWRGDFSAVTVFGSQLLTDKVGGNLIICEGENDTLAAASMFSGSEWTVVGISGTGNVARIKPVLNAVRKFTRIYVCMDNDDAGDKAFMELNTILPAGKVHRVRLPPGVKDVNDMTMSGRRPEFVRAVRVAQAILPPGIVSKEDIIRRTLEYQFNRSSRPKVSTGINELDDATGGLAPGRLITIVGDTGIGKSTVAEQIAVDAARQKVHSFVISLEMPDTEVNTRMCQNVLRKPLYADPNFNFDSLNQDHHIQTLEYLNEYVHFYQHLGVMSTEKLVEVCNYAVDVFDVGVIIVDNYTSASDSLDWKDLDKFTQQLKNEVALSRNVCIVGVSHISRENFTEGTVPALRNIRGGAGAAQQSDIVLAVGRKLDTNVLNFKVIKNRVSGGQRSFDLTMEGYRLVGKSPNNLPEILDMQLPKLVVPPEEDEQPPRNTSEDRTAPLPESVRVPSPSGDGSGECGIRADDNTIHVGEEVQAGLCVGERNSSRDKGGIYNPRQAKNARGKETKPSARYSLSFPEPLHKAFAFAYNKHELVYTERYALRDKLRAEELAQRITEDLARHTIEPLTF